MSFEEKIGEAYELAQTLTREAGDLAKDMQTKPMSVTHDDTTTMKGIRNISTSADFAAQNLILDGIIKAGLNDARIWAEEEHPETEEYINQFSIEGICQWTVDPIDGSSNYGHGHHELSRMLEKYVADLNRDPRRELNALNWGPMVGLVKDEPEFGCLYLPAHGKLFHARKGQGAFLDDRFGSRAISTSRKDSFNMGSDIVYANSDIMMKVERHQDKGISFKYHGSYASSATAIAEGSRPSIILSEQPLRHDLIPPWCLVKEAGGVVLDENGMNATLDSRFFIFGPNKKYVETFLALLNTRYDQILEGNL